MGVEDDDDELPWAPPTAPNKRAFAPFASAPSEMPIPAEGDAPPPPTADLADALGGPTEARRPAAQMESAGAPVADVDGDGGVFEVTLPGDGASSLGGGLSAGRMARVVMTLFANERSGRLVVESGTRETPGIRGTLYFLRGEPVHAMYVDADARLLGRLRAAGELDAAAQADPALPLVPLLVRKKWARATAILFALRQEVRDFLAGALSADIGVFRFFDDTELADHVPLVGVNPFAMLLEQRRSAHPPATLLQIGEDIAAKYLVPAAGFANAASRLAAFTGGVDVESLVDGTTTGRDVYETARLDALSGGLVVGSLVDAGLLTLTDTRATVPQRDKRRAPESALPMVLPTEGLSLVGAATPAGADILALYLLLKPERDEEAILAVPKDASILEVERGFRARMQQLDPRLVPRGPGRPHLLARVEELRTKVERAYQAAGAARLASGETERVREFDIVEKLGEGGMAEVFVARTVVDGAAGPTATSNVARIVAIKRIREKYRNDEKFARMFLREARLTRRIEHENVVRVLAVGQSGDDLYLAMEYVDGADLARLLVSSIKARKRVPLEVACRIVADVCGGLHAAHTAHDAAGNVIPILHRDVSPQNILISAAGDVKLTDFGVAKAVGSQTESIERTGFVHGKVTYLAPELIDGFPATVRTDVYAAAIVLYGCLAKLPFKKGDLLQTMRAILTDPVPPLSKARDDCPKRLDDILLRATAKDPEERQGSAQELQMELEELLTELPAVDVGAWVRDMRARADAASQTGPGIPAAVSLASSSSEKTGLTRVPIVEKLNPDA